MSTLIYSRIMRALIFQIKIKNIQSMHFTDVLIGLKSVGVITDDEKKMIKDLYDKLSSFIHPITHRGLRGLLGIVKQRNYIPPSFLTITPTKYFMSEEDQEELRRYLKTLREVSEAIHKLVKAWQERIKKAMP